MILDSRPVWLGCSLLRGEPHSDAQCRTGRLAWEPHAPCIQHYYGTTPFPALVILSSQFCDSPLCIRYTVSTWQKYCGGVVPDVPAVAIFELNRLIFDTDFAMRTFQATINLEFSLLSVYC